MRNPQLVVPFLRRGSVWLFHQFPFSNTNPQPKYYVVMQYYDDSLTDTIVVLTTSHVWKKHRGPWMIVIPDSTTSEFGIPGDSLLDLHNQHVVPVEAFWHAGVKYLGDLSPTFMAKVDMALEQATQLPVEIYLRMRPSGSYKP